MSSTGWIAPSSAAARCNGMELLDKLAILTDAAKYDAACTSSGVRRSARPGMIGNTTSSIAGCCHSFAADGRCITLLKVLMTNVCVYDCAYCVNRVSNEVPRAAFKPRELADLTISFYRRNYIEGLFVSSGVIKSPDYTTELMIETLRILRSHVFNWLIWPDFSSIPDRGNPFLRFQEMHIGESANIGGGRRMTALPALHTVPAVAYQVSCDTGSLVFSGDTTYSEPLIAAINDIPDLRYLLVETAFPDALHDLAIASRHLCPSLLALFLDRIKVSPEVWITHLKPSRAQITVDEIGNYRGRFQPKALYNGLEFII